MTLLRTAVLAVVGLSALILSTGCSGGGEDEWTAKRPPVVPAEGTVTYKGEPVEGATVTFIEEGGTNSAAGVTDSSGHFSANAFPPDEGAVAGKYKVTVRKTESAATPAAGSHEDSSAPPRDLLPIKYTKPETSGLTAEIPADGKTDFEFKLTD